MQSNRMFSFENGDLKQTLREGVCNGILYKLRHKIVVRTLE